MGRAWTVSLLLYLEAALFLATMALVSLRPKWTVGEYVGILFHLLLLPVVAVETPPGAGQACGYLWVLCDVVAALGMLWNWRADETHAGSVFVPVRMAGHLFASVWVVVLSWSVGGFLRVDALLLAVAFSGYSLAAGRLPMKAQALGVPLMALWLVGLGWVVAQS